MNDPYQTTPIDQRSTTGSSGVASADKLAQDVDAAQRKVRDDVEELRQEASDLPHRVKHGAQDVVRQAKDKVRGYAAESKDAAVGRVKGVANALRQAADSLDEQDQSMFAGYARQAASTIDQASDALRRHEVSDVVEVVEDFARRQPVVFIGGAFVAGLLLARFMKSSAARSYGSYQDHPGSPLHDDYRGSMSAGRPLGEPH